MEEKILLKKIGVSFILFLIIYLLSIASLFIIQSKQDFYDEKKRAEIFSINNKYCYYQAINGKSLCMPKHYNFLIQHSSVKILEYNLKKNKFIEKLKYLSVSEYYFIYFFDYTDTALKKHFDNNKVFLFLLALFFLAFFDFKKFFFKIFVIFVFLLCLNKDASIFYIFPENEATLKESENFIVPLYSDSFFNIFDIFLVIVFYVFFVFHSYLYNKKNKDKKYYIEKFNLKFAIFLFIYFFGYNFQVFLNNDYKTNYKYLISFEKIDKYNKKHYYFGKTEHLPSKKNFHGKFNGVIYSNDIKKRTIKEQLLFEDRTMFPMEFELYESMNYEDSYHKDRLYVKYLDFIPTSDENLVNFRFDGTNSYNNSNYKDYSYIIDEVLIVNDIYNITILKKELIQLNVQSKNQISFVFIFFIIGIILYYFIVFIETYFSNNFLLKSTFIKWKLKFDFFNKNKFILKQLNNINIKYFKDENVFIDNEIEKLTIDLKNHSTQLNKKEKYIFILNINKIIEDEYLFLYSPPFNIKNKILLDEYRIFKLNMIILMINTRKKLLQELNTVGFFHINHVFYENLNDIDIKILNDNHDLCPDEIFKAINSIELNKKNIEHFFYNKFEGDLLKYLIKEKSDLIFILNNLNLQNCKNTMLNILPFIFLYFDMNEALEVSSKYNIKFSLFYRTDIEFSFFKYSVFLNPSLFDLITTKKNKKNLNN